MGQDPSEIRNDIEGTRARMGDTVEALGHKADVPGRAKEAVSNRLGDVRSKISGATPESDEVKDGARHAAGVAQENPLGLAVGAAAVGFIAGMLVIWYFMEVRNAPVWLKATASAWVVVLFSLLLGFYFSGP